MKESDLALLPPLSVPLARLRIVKDEAEDLSVFDILRKKYIKLTPEEFVRQNFVHWLIGSFHYPSGLMANEIEIKLNDTKKRCDTVIFDKNCKPLIIVEYKAPDVEITQATFDQIARYNLKLKAKYLIVSNGRKQYCCIMDYDNDRYHFIPQIPDYAEASLPGIN